MSATSSRDERRRRLDEALAKYLERVDSGELVDRAELLAQHPDLAVDIEAFLNDDRALARVANPVETVAFMHTPTGRGSRGLHIRCPHCTNQVELLVDTPYEEITCHSCGSHFSLVDREEATRLATPLKSIGRFELISRLGVGGFGSVWKARDTELDRVVAVKIPRKGQLSNDEIEQFFREARSAAQLRHPNIVPVHEVGRAEGTIFIVCDLVRGVELNDWLTGERPPFRDIAALCRKIAGSLHHAHQHGVIHRDLKPSNVMIDLDGEPQLMDFGLAKREVGEVTMTVDGQVLGTPAYMSPEQAGGHSHWTDRRTDIYSLGVILFRMLTGELPFRGNAQMQVHRRLTEDAPDPRKLNKHIPKDLATICLKCLERDPNRRYATADALAKEFERFTAGVPIEARPISRIARLARWAKRKPALAAVAGLLVLLAVAGPTAAVVIESQRRRTAELVVEKNNLIDRYVGDQRTDQATIAGLTDRLDMWEGRTNPFEFWPPVAAIGPRQNLLHKLYDQRYAATAAKLQGGAEGADDWDAARGHLGLAVLAHQTKHRPEALKHLSATKKILQKLHRDDPARPAVAAALAQCNLILAELNSEEAPQDADQQLKEAGELFKRLARESSTPNKYRLELLDAELRRAMAAGFEAGKEHLGEAARLDKQLQQEWPADPVKLYELVCLLANREAAE